MNFNQYTTKSQEAVQEAQNIATANGQQAIETGHILKALMEVDENVVPFLLKKLNINIAQFENKLNTIVANYPKVSGASPYLGNDASAALQKAQQLIKEFKDEFVSVEHVLLGILSGKDNVAKLLKEEGVNEKELRNVILDLRKGERVTSASAEETYNSLCSLCPA